jgi:hypothetical protein
MKNSELHSPVPSKITEEGKQACHDGLFADENPYDRGTDSWLDWKVGFMIAQEDRDIWEQNNRIAAHRAALALAAA